MVTKTEAAPAVNTISNMTEDDLDTRIQSIINRNVEPLQREIRTVASDLKVTDEKLAGIAQEMSDLHVSMKKQEDALEGALLKFKENSQIADSRHDEIMKTLSELRSGQQATPAQATPAPAATNTAQTTANAPAATGQAAAGAAAGAAEAAKKSEWKPGQMAVAATLAAAVAGGGGYMYGRRRGQRMSEQQGGGEGGGTAGGRGRAGMH